MYRDILSRASSHFQEVAKEQPQNLQCGRGCSFCCYGLFEIGSGDVAVIAEGLRNLDPVVRKKIVGRARSIVRKTGHPDIRSIDSADRDLFFERTASVPCPNLGEEGECLIYDSRPIVCRTFGLPIREGDRYIGDICDLNFTAASQEEKEAAAWDLLGEDPVSPEDEYTIPEAILMAARLGRW